MNDTQQTTVSWRAAEFEYVERSRGWYVLLGIVAAIFIAASLWQGNVFFALFIALAGVVLVTVSRRKPPVVEFCVDGEGVSIGTRRLQYDDLEGFSFHDRPGRLDQIILKRKSGAVPLVRIPVDSKTAERVQSVLAVYLPPFEHEETITDSITDLFGL